MTRPPLWRYALALPVAAFLGAAFWGGAAVESAAYLIRHRGPVKR